jgi:hypothetical protein
MPPFAVRFKGMLTKEERQRLTAAGIEITSSEPSMQTGFEGGSLGTSRPIYTAAVEAASEEEALAKVREALEPDTANFSNWEAGPA